MKTLYYYSSTNNIGLNVLGILVGSFIVFIIGINIYGALKNWIERENERAKKAQEEIKKRNQRIADIERRESEKKQREKKEEELKIRKKRWDEIERIEYEEKQREEEIKKERQRISDIETQNNVFNFPSSFIMNESYKIDVDSSDQTLIVLRNRDRFTRLSKERFFNLYVIQRGQVLKDTAFGDEFRQCGCCITIRNFIERDPNFKIDQSFTLTVIKTLYIRNEFVNKPDVPIYWGNRYSMYRQYVIETRKLSRPTERHLSVLLEKYGQSTPTNEIIKLEWEKLNKMLYSSELIVGTTDEHLRTIPVFVLN